MELKKILSKLLLCLFLFSFTDTSLSQVNFTDSNLPIIVINTNGQTIVDDPKIDCAMGIIWNGDGNRNYLTDDFNDFDGNIGIEIRGSTSQQYPKKSYSVETRDAQGDNLNVSLLGLPKENDWILYGAYPDKSLMRNEITYALFAQMQPWSPRFVYCELVINDEYLGVYTLIEKIKRDNDRVDIEKLEPSDDSGDELTGGYIVKVDKLTGSSSTPWVSSYQDELKFLYHDPKYEDLTDNQRAYIQNYMSDFEDAVYSDDFTNPELGYRPYIDVGSFVDFMIMQELGRTVDGYRSSSFMYKDRDSNGGKLTCGPMWDFNLSYGNADYCEAYSLEGWQYNFEEVCGEFFNSTPPNWWSRMLEDSTYTSALKCRWLDLRSGILSTESINAWIDSMALYLEESQERNFEKWPILGEYVNWNYYIGETFQEEVDYLKWWFQARSEYLDENFPGTCSNPTAVTPVSNKANASLVYPNPTNRFIHLAVPIRDKSALRFFSVSGEEHSVELRGNTIDLENISDGVYILSYQGAYWKIVKTHN
jgi:hypothetical protein